jgi:hypothetical protein
MIKRRKIKDLSCADINHALDTTSNWRAICHIVDGDNIHSILVGGIYKALDIIAPTKSMSVRNGEDLYLSNDTLSIMVIRDKAKGGNAYRDARNRVTAMVRRDKQLSNLAKLKGSRIAPRALWEIANSALGKARHTLPETVKNNGVETSGPMKMAAAVNQFYVDKVARIRATIARAAAAFTAAWPPATASFEFKFASASRIWWLVRSLGSSEALGVDTRLVPKRVIK